MYVVNVSMYNIVTMWKCRVKVSFSETNSR